MARYNVNFELTVEDMELIEESLRQVKSSMASELIKRPSDGDAPCEVAQELDSSVRQIHDLLGRLHNQKVFYRPRGDVYVGG